MIGDTINIKDAFIVNIGIDFQIITLPNYNNNQVYQYKELLREKVNV